MQCCFWHSFGWLLFYILLFDPQLFVSAMTWYEIVHFSQGLIVEKIDFFNVYWWYSTVVAKNPADVHLCPDPCPVCEEQKKQCFQYKHYKYQVVPAQQCHHQQQQIAGSHVLVHPKLPTVCVVLLKLHRLK
jgi:hypothetical protein